MVKVLDTGTRDLKVLSDAYAIIELLECRPVIVLIAGGVVEYGGI